MNMGECRNSKGEFQSIRLTFPRKGSLIIMRTPKPMVTTSQMWIQHFTCVIPNHTHKNTNKNLKLLVSFPTTQSAHKSTSPRKQYGRIQRTALFYVFICLHSNFRNDITKGLFELWVSVSYMLLIGLCLIKPHILHLIDYNLFYT